MKTLWFCGLFLNAVAEYLLDNYQIVESYINKVIEGRGYVKTELNRLGIKCNGETTSALLIDLIDSKKRDQVVSFLESNLIYVRGDYPAPWDKYMLISVGPVELMERFIEAMVEVNKKFF